jgi:hypothetical protein
VSTHDVAVGAVVVKRFRSWERGEHRREWLGLRLLDHFSPGLAPRPLSAQLDADPPVITMSRLPGDPLGDKPLDAAGVAAIAAALDRLHSAVPERIAAQVAPSHGHPYHGLALLRDRLDAVAEPDAAIRAARRWLRSTEAAGTTDLDAAPPVYGREDHNLANFLDDGDRLQLVDFEDAGRSDRATEAAALVEHRSARSTPDASWRPLLDAVADQPRLRAARRYYAALWIALLLRLPGGRHQAQSERLLRLL